MSTILIATDDQELHFAYMLIIIIADNASPEKIASGIPESELRTLVDHTRDTTLDTLSTDSNWLRSGEVAMHHDFLLKTADSLSKNPSFIKMFLSNEGMEAVAKFYASRKKNDTPNTCVAEMIQLLANNPLCVLIQEGPSVEQALGTIEKTGLLGQYIRCVPVDPERSANVVKNLQKCLQLVKKKLRSGTPTGDVLDAVIAGKDGPTNEKAKCSLARLQSLARLSNCDAVNRCHHCEKMETQMDNAKLMKCQRCKQSYYCSEECQVADWKYHKKLCKAIASKDESRSAGKTGKTVRTTISAFLKSNSLDIAKEVHKKTQEFNVPKTELLVEIYFFGDAPALRNECKVWLTSGFLEGSSVADAPGWFRIHSEKKSLVLFLRKEYEQVTSDHLLAVCRAGNGMVSAPRLYIKGV